MECVKNFDLKNFNTYKISSVADIAYFPKNLDEFIELLKTLKNPFILGNGSNVLLSSSGIKEPVIITKELNKVVDFEAETGVKAPYLAQLALKNSLTGLEFLATIPASIGGAMVMNASAHSQKISDVFKSALLFDFETSEVKEFSKEEMKFSYRNSILKTGRYVFLKGKFELQKGNFDEIKNKMDENLNYRKLHQPNLSTPNAGSVFKNPAGNSAGRLIQECNLKGKTIGGAKISELHGNFIISENATSSDIVELMFFIYNEVKTKTNIELESEIIFVGRKNELEEKIWEQISKKQNA